MPQREAKQSLLNYTLELEHSKQLSFLFCYGYALLSSWWTPVVVYCRLYCAIPPCILRRDELRATDAGMVFVNPYKAFTNSDNRIEGLFFGTLV
jgi:hypothetical protein